MLASTLKSIVKVSTASQGFLIAVVLLTAVVMMILPIPTILVDIFIGFNFGTAVLLLMTAVYLRSPLDFSSLPGVILISTVFRLSLAITTTRLILTEGDAGTIVRTFGEFVVAGSVIVGLVVFLITTIVQFIVVAKGAERVAEVGARFTLDALPGKQVSIDAELRNGDIDQAEARRRRLRLERESQLFGAMDGAMKFVKGDAIAGLIIIFINLIGGISIGAAQKGLSFEQAVHEYSLLTIGDALISQIPSLFLSITAGIIVTRVASEHSRDLGDDIIEQILADRRALRLASGVLVGMGLVPGFPTVVLFIIAAAFGAISFLKQGDEALDGTVKSSKDKQIRGKANAQDKQLVDEEEKLAPVMVRLSPSLQDAIQVSKLKNRIESAQKDVSTQLGVACPAVGVRFDLNLDDFRYDIDSEGVPVFEGRLMLDRLVLHDDVAHLEILNIPYERIEGGGNLKAMITVSADYRSAIATAGIGFLDNEDIIADQLKTVLKKISASYVGIQETRALLSKFEAHYGDLVKEVMRVTPVQKISDVFRRLLEENVSVRNTRIVLEALAEWGEKERNPILLAEYVRSALKRQICYSCANDHKIISAFMISRELEDTIRASIRETAVGGFLVLEDNILNNFIGTIRKHIIKMNISQPKPVVVASVDIRRYVRNLLARNDIDISVLSYQDLADDFTVQPISVIQAMQSSRAA